MFRQLLVLASLVAVAHSACPNSCSGHGHCNNNDQCECHATAKKLNTKGIDRFADPPAQYTGADCSLFTCPKGTSWTDVSTTMRHKKSAECSDKGLCDRNTGLCECFNGYTGSACQRTACPKGCSGHGVCMANNEFAIQYAMAMSTRINENKMTATCDNSTTVCTNIENWQSPLIHVDDYFNTFIASYEHAWDSEMNYGCKCDDGFRGADCSQKECPSGDNPGDDNCRFQLLNVGKFAYTTKLDDRFAPKEMITKDNYKGFFASLGQDTALDSFFKKLLLEFSASKPMMSIGGGGDLSKMFQTHYEDLARACAAYTSAQTTTATTYDKKTSLNTQKVKDVIVGSNGIVHSKYTIHNWFCDFTDSAFSVAVPYCSGRVAGQVCSNKGKCNTNTGQCQCQQGYEGRACESTSSALS